MRRRGVNVFGLAFLDVMFCGFGAVVLLVMLLHGQTLARRHQIQQDLRGAVARLGRTAQAEDETLAALRQSLARATRETEQARARASRLRVRTAQARAMLAAIQHGRQAGAASVASLAEQLRTLERKRLALRAEPRRGAARVAAPRCAPFWVTATAST